MKIKDSKPPDGYVQLGTLGKTFQLKGGLRFYPLGEAEAEAFTVLKHVFVEGVGETDLRNVKVLGKGLVVYLTAGLTLEQARGLVNRAVYAASGALPEPDPDAIYIDELVDQPVYLNGESYGRVAEVLDADMQDILKIHFAGRGEVMVPLQAPYVEVTDDGVYLENVPEGLLELNS